MLVSEITSENKILGFALFGRCMLRGVLRLEEKKTCPSAYVVSLKREDFVRADAQSPARQTPKMLLFSRVSPSLLSAIMQRSRRRRRRQSRYSLRQLSPISAIILLPFIFTCARAPNPDELGEFKAKAFGVKSFVRNMVRPTMKFHGDGLLQQAIDSETIYKVLRMTPETEAQLSYLLGLQANATDYQVRL